MLDGSMWRVITVKLTYQIKQVSKMFIRVFTQNFWWEGLAFGDDLRSPLGTESDGKDSSWGPS